VATHIFCKSLTESNVTDMPSVICMDWLHWWYKHAAHVVSSSTALVFLTKMSEIHKSPSSSAIQVKNWQRTFSNEEKLHIISYLKNVNKSLTYAIMSDLLIVAHAELVIMLIALRKVPSQEQKFFFVVRLPHSCQNEQYQKLWMWVS